MAEEAERALAFQCLSKHHRITSSYVSSSELAQLHPLLLDQLWIDARR